MKFFDERRPDTVTHPVACTFPDSNLLSFCRDRDFRRAMEDQGEGAGSFNDDGKRKDSGGGKNQVHPSGLEVDVNESRSFDVDNLNADEIELGPKIGSGASAEVFEAMYCGAYSLVSTHRLLYGGSVNIRTALLTDTILCTSTPTPSPPCPHSLPRCSLVPSSFSFVCRYACRGEEATRVRIQR
jgi:hypothetical protein